jgi:hypothetical protein
MSIEPEECPSLYTCSFVLVVDPHQSLRSTQSQESSKMAEIAELLQFLSMKTRADVRGTALEVVLGVTASKVACLMMTRDGWLMGLDRKAKDSLNKILTSLMLSLQLSRYAQPARLLVVPRLNSS